MEDKKEKKKKKKQITFRMNIIFFSVFLFFSILILRLGYLQIVTGEDYKKELERTEEITINTSEPRGKIFDRNYQIMVYNEALNAITYTKSSHTKQSEMVEVAERLSTIITMDTARITKRDLQDFWILKHPQEAEDKITAAEKKQWKAGNIDDQTLYKMQRERITEAELNSFSEKDFEVLAIYRQFTSGYAHTPQIVKNQNITNEEFALVSENLANLPGVGITTDWNRKYAFEDRLKTILGKVSSTEEGLPSEKLDYYLDLGYSRNDRVGTSYLEMQYEEELQGKKEKIRKITNKSGRVIGTEVIEKGKRGNDLVLTVDMDLQIALEDEIERQLRTKKKSSSAKFLDRAFIVLMNPQTGEVLAMAGKQYTHNEKTGKVEFNDFALGNITTSYTVGSSVKGATVLTGFETGAIAPGTVLYDEPLYIKGTPKKSSYANFGNINDLTALKVSSNVYMFKTVINMAGAHYIPDSSLRISGEDFDTLRSHFVQFGLGANTGIDLPNESMGYTGADVNPGKLLDLAIGQFDTYTPMQLAQYVSTIANGGKRIQPHIVKEIRQPSEEEILGAPIKAIKPKVLNKLKVIEKMIKRVQTGFEKVTNEAGGTANGAFRNLPVRVAAKTGTAEAYYDGPNKEQFGSIENRATMSLSFVGYAPANNPEIAFAVVVPWAYQRNGTSHVMNKELATFALKTYYQLKEKRAQS